MTLIGRGDPAHSTAGGFGAGLGLTSLMILDGLPWPLAVVLWFGVALATILLVHVALPVAQAAGAVACDELDRRYRRYVRRVE